MDNIWIFIDNLTFQHALVLANFIMVCVTIVLVFVTWLYTRQTKRMADIMHKDFELRINPQYQFKVVNVQEEESYLTGSIMIKNVGLTPIFARNIIVSVVPFIVSVLRKDKILHYNDQIRIDPGDPPNFTNFTVEVSEVAINPPAKGEKFFGKLCNIVVSCEISGPTQDFKEEKVVIV